MTSVDQLDPRPEDMVHYLDSWVRHITLLGQLVRDKDAVILDLRVQLGNLQTELQRRADLEPEIALREEELERFRGVVDGLERRNQQLLDERNEAIERLAAVLEIKPQKVDGWLIVAIHRAVRLVQETKNMIKQSV